jgi:hypothetical protein
VTGKDAAVNSSVVCSLASLPPPSPVKVLSSTRVLSARRNSRSSSWPRTHSVSQANPAPSDAALLTARLQSPVVARNPDVPGPSRPPSNELCDRNTRPHALTHVDRSRRPYYLRSYYSFACEFPSCWAPSQDPNHPGHSPRSLCQSWDPHLGTSKGASRLVAQHVTTSAVRRHDNSHEEGYEAEGIWYAALPSAHFLHPVELVAYLLTPLSPYRVRRFRRRYRLPW